MTTSSLYKSAALAASALVVQLLVLPLASADDEWGLGAFRDPLTVEDPATQPRLGLGGYLRLRGDRLTNLDLDRGATTSTGETLYPLPLTDPGGQDSFGSGNMRLRLEPTIRVGWEVTVHATIDCLDNVVMGSTPADSSRWAAMGAAATSQEAPEDSIRVKRAWAEVGTPFGLLTAGRMGVHWGLGMVANSGDCLDCDQGDTVDRVGIAMPLFGHIIGLSYDISSSGPTVDRWDGVGQAFDAEPSDDVRSASFGLMQFHTPAVRNVLLRDGRSVLDYGVALSYRWQDLDFPTWGAGSAELPDERQAVTRGFSGFLVDGFVSWELPRNRLDLEVAVLLGSMDDASLVPGMETDKLESLQYGGVLRDRFQATPWARIGFELGLASGDPAPGFGARPGLEQAKTRPGDMDGPQLALPDDLRVDNFRFHPDYHVDLILWRELVGTVTDGLYLKPSLELGPAQGFTLELSMIYSQAMEEATPPGGEAPLGVETDVQLRYRSPDGFVASVEYGILFPLAGLDNPELGLDAQRAQRLHAIMGVLF